MHRSANDKPEEPWYRQGWPWFLIAFPAIAVVAGIATLVIGAEILVQGAVAGGYALVGAILTRWLPEPGASVEH